MKSNPGSPLHALSAGEAVEAMVHGRLQAEAYADALLERIAKTDPGIEAWAYLKGAHVRHEAQRCDERTAHERGPLHGLPVGIKDIIHTRTLPTRMGSPAFDDFVAPADAGCVQRLMAAGAYVAGKTVTTELAFMHPGKTKNPWNPAHTPGGSSQGSAAAVAAGHVPLALGTQTNGSVIRPAAYCGVVGFKPSLGLIPFTGVNVFSPTLDTLGTFTRSVADAALAVSVLGGEGAPGAGIPALESPPRLAYLDGFPWIAFDCDADDVLEAAASHLRAAGAQVVPVTLPDALGETLPVFRRIMLHEAGRELASLQDRERTRLSSTLNAALDEGRAIGVEDYRRALQRRQAMIAAAVEWMGPYDALIAPSTPTAAPASLDTTGDPSCCTLGSLLGAPAITLPAGFDGSGMPIGMQLLAPPSADGRLLAVARWCETRMPPFKGLV